MNDEAEFGVDDISEEEFIRKLKKEVIMAKKKKAKAKKKKKKTKKRKSRK
jgi:hypothetical protein